MYKLNQSLANTKRNSQAFACLLFSKHNDVMDIVNIRRKKLKQWFADKSIPEKEKSYISQLISGRASFGEKAARRLERTYQMPDMYLDDRDDSQRGIDMSRLTMEQLEFAKKMFGMDSDEFRKAKELFLAADAVTKARKRENKNGGDEGDSN